MVPDRVKLKREADRLLTAGRVERAIEAFRQLVEDNPRDFATLNQLGDLCLQVGRVEEGVEIHKRLAQAYERDGFHARAAAIYQKVVRQAPEELEASQRLAELYRQMNRLGDAVRVHLQVAEALQRRGLFRRALEEFHRIVDLDPKNLLMKVRLADLCHREGLQERAAGLYLEVAEALAQERRHEEARQVLDRARTLAALPQVFLAAGRIAQLRGDGEAALGALQEGLERHPRHPDLLGALADLHLRQGRPEASLQTLAQLSPPTEAALPATGRALRALAQAGRADEALVRFEPLALELARRGWGEAAGRCLKESLEGCLGGQGWLLLAELARESGDRPGQVAALQEAHGAAAQAGDRPLAVTAAQRLEGLGAIPREPEAPPKVTTPEVPEVEALDLGWLHQGDPTETTPVAPLAGGDLPLAFLDLGPALDAVWAEAQEGSERHDTTPQAQRVQSLEELFEAFRAGVARQVRPEDYATHFDLGVGYLEMGLLEPALEAFQRALGDPERTLACCSLLARGEQARGHLAEAIAWLRQGITAEGFPPEDALGLRYDLANLLLLHGDPAGAQVELQAIGAVDPTYRDVAARLA